MTESVRSEAEVSEGTSAGDEPGVDAEGLVPEDDVGSVTPAATGVDAATQEIRLALALNGGVSLAIWMGGAAVELDSARRAHLAPEIVAVPVADDDTTAAPPPARTIYNALCQGFQRSVVIDVMTGASAGGINGALLAGAIRSRRRLHPDFLRSKWAQIGDFSKLLQPLANDRPQSIMQGDLFHKEIRLVFQAVLGSTDAPDEELALTALPVAQRALPAHDANLDITATDVIGEERLFRDDWGFDLYARDHRARFKFRDGSDFTVDNLATAARASASFPAAFEPVLVDRPAQQRLAGFSGSRWLIDGGLLDNAPIRSALRLIPSRRAAREVERILCYVNADPAAPDEPRRFGIHGPTLLNVGGYVVGLPRTAPFIDHIEAMQVSVRERATVAETLVPLLSMNLAELNALATQLLPAYSEGRRLVAIADLFGSTGSAAQDAATYLDIHWPTFALDPPYSADRWTWGIRSATDIVHLILDVMRAAIRRTPGDERTELLDQRLAVFDALEALLSIERLSRRAADEGASSDAALDVTSGYNRASFGMIKRAATAAYKVAAHLGQLPDGRAIGDVLFGTTRPAEMADGNFDLFLQRALAIEVVRRSFTGDAEVMSAQRLSFAQLTPLAPCPLFTYTPFADDGPATPEAKLTGIRLGHFAAFYRTSWRINDFMWGRLDAAARVVQILVDPLRANDPCLDPEKPHAATTIAKALLPPNATPEQRWLVDEALADAAVADPGANRAMGEVAASLAGYQAASSESPPASDVLRPQLQTAIEIDLRNIDGGRFTRVVCIRGAQLEILAHELPYLVKASKADVHQGTLAPALDVPTIATSEAIRNIRDGFDNGDTLPKRLGRDRPDELASALALRTTTHAALVALAALREAKIPLAGFVNTLRTPLLPAAGLVSRDNLYRATALLAYWAAALYLTGRIVTTGLDTSVEENRVLAGVLALIAVLVILGTAGVPFLRARQAKSSRALSEYAFAVAFVVLGFLGAGILAAWRDERGLRDLIVAPDSRTAGALALGFAVAVGAGLPRARLPIIGAAVNRIIVKPWAGISAAVVVFLALAVLVVPAVWGIYDVMRADPEGWEIIAVLLAGLSGPVAATYLVLRGGR